MIVALNNKCNLKKEEFKEYICELNKIETNHEMILCPTIINIACIDTKQQKLTYKQISNIKIRLAFVSLIFL